MAGGAIHFLQHPPQADGGSARDRDGKAGMRGTDQAEVVERQPFGQQPAETPHDPAFLYFYLWESGFRPSEIATLNRPFSRGRGAAASTLNGFARQLGHRVQKHLPP